MTATTLDNSTKPSSVCEPRWITRRRNRPSFGEKVAKIAALLEAPLMDWQSRVAMVAGELEDGKPAYREVFFTAPRQQGKTLLVVAWLLYRCLFWSKRPQMCAYTAQTGKDARSKWLDEVVPMLYQSPWKQYIQ